jgi:hypothetical protein
MKVQKMITCKELLDIINEQKLGDVYQIGISPLTILEWLKYGGSKHIISRSPDKICNEDHDKIVIDVIIINTNKISQYKFCEKLLFCNLMDNLYFETIPNDENPQNKYIVLLQKIGDKVTIAKKPFEGKPYSGDFDNVDKAVFSDISVKIKLYNKILNKGLPIIVD